MDSPIFIQTFGYLQQYFEGSCLQRDVATVKSPSDNDYISDVTTRSHFGIFTAVGLLKVFDRPRFSAEMRHAGATTALYTE